MDKRKEYDKLYAKFNDALPKVCANCASTDDLMIHHIVPLCYGGNNVLTNLARLCSDCHAQAHGGSSFTKAVLSTRRRNAALGRWPAGSIPYGYKSVGGRLQFEDNNADIVRWIFHLRYDSELGTSLIAEVLNEMAIPPARYGKKWTHVAVRKILDNKVYFGRLTHKDVDYGDLIVPIFTDDMQAKIDRFNLKYAGTRVSPGLDRIIKETPAIASAS